MFSYIKNIFRQITVEPINVLFLVGILSVESVRQDFFLQTICRHEFPGNDACNSSSNYNKTMKDVVETKTATYITIWYTIYHLITIIFIRLYAASLKYLSFWKNRPTFRFKRIFLMIMLQFLVCHWNQFCHPYYPSFLDAGQIDMDANCL